MDLSFMSSEFDLAKKRIMLKIFDDVKDQLVTMKQKKKTFNN